MDLEFAGAAGSAAKAAGEAFGQTPGLLRHECDSSQAHVPG